MSTLTGSELRTYIESIFKRDDKETELYEAVSDTIREIRRRFNMDEDETEKETSDTISVLGDYRVDDESDHGFFLTDVVLVDGTQSWPLTKVSKSQYDRLYPNQNATNVFKGRPVHWAYFAGQIHIGPVPDSTDYAYRINYVAEDGAQVTSSTDPVPYSNIYQELLRAGTLQRLFLGLEQFQQMQIWEREFEKIFGQIAEKETFDKAGTPIVMYRGF